MRYRKRKQLVVGIVRKMIILAHKDWLYLEELNGYAKGMIDAINFLDLKRGNYSDQKSSRSNDIDN